MIVYMDSSESRPTAHQDGSAYNGHFGCTCYHPLFVFQPTRDLERCALREATCIVLPLAGRAWSRWSPATGHREAALISAGTQPLPIRRSTSLEAEATLCDPVAYQLRLAGKIGHLLKRPVGRPPQQVRRFFASFSYRAQSWN